MNFMKKVIGVCGMATSLMFAPAVVADDVHKGVLDEVNATRTKVVIDGISYRLVNATRIGETLSPDEEVFPLERKDLSAGSDVFYQLQESAEEPTLKFIYIQIQ